MKNENPGGQPGALYREDNQSTPARKDANVAFPLNIGTGSPVDPEAEKT